MTKKFLALSALGLGLGFSLSACKDKGGLDTGGNTSGDGGDGGSGCDDADGDGFCVEDDCDDNDASVNPDAAEICDSIDNNCDGTVDEGVTDTFYADADGDGFGDAGTTSDRCEPGDGWVPTSDDCDDTDSAVHPGATEECDGLDNDCDNEIDEGLDAGTYYADTDSDGWGDPDNSITTCDPDEGWVDNDMDCDDNDDGEPVIVSQTGPVSKDHDSGWDSGAGTGSGTADDPYSQIQDGINNSDVCVHVYPGSYNEDLSFHGRNIVVEGVEGKDMTTIQGSGTTSVVTFDDNESGDATLRGFTVTGGVGTLVTDEVVDSCGSGETCTITTWTYYGGGIYISNASATLEELTIIDNQLAPYSYTQTSPNEEEYVYSYGGGVYAENGSVDMNAVAMVNNFADTGGGSYLGAGATGDIAHGWVDANWGCTGAGVGSESSFTATNTVLVNNAYNASGGCSGSGGAGVDVADGTAMFTNVSAVGNDGLASVFLGAAATTTVINSIVAENADGAAIDADSGTSLSLTYSNVFNSLGTAYGSGVTDITGTDGNISDDPLFASWTDDGDSSDDDFALGTGSPSIDAGSPVSAYDDVDGTTNDQGAYGGPNGSW